MVTDPCPPLCLAGLDVWKNTMRSRWYDASLISQRLAYLREVGKSGDVYAVIYHLKAGMLRNFGGLTNPKLFEKTHVGTKVLIEEVSGGRTLPRSPNFLFFSYIDSYMISNGFYASPPYPCPLPRVPPYLVVYVVHYGDCGPAG